MPKLMCGFSACKFNSATKPRTTGECNCTETVNLQCCDLEPMICRLEHSQDEITDYLENLFDGFCTLNCNNYVHNPGKLSEEEE